MLVTVTTRLLGDNGALCEVCCRLFCPCVAELVFMSVTGVLILSFFLVTTVVSDVQISM